ncbi:hypothetical protein BI317_20025 [Xanthomonas hortorum pv. gardneri]|nr:hypothetical protein BI317_20025 [Xanthomonas hortorum pv. gardneri]
MLRAAVWLQGSCPPTVAGPYAAWMPRKSLHGRTCGVSCDGGRARTGRDSRCACFSSNQQTVWCGVPQAVRASRA